MKVLDTTFLVDVIRGKKETEEIMKSNDALLTTQINMYEVLEGFFLKSITSQKYMEIIELFDNVRVLPLDDSAIIQAARLSASLSKQGNTIADCDCLIAGIVLSKGITTIVTKNVKDFEKIKGLEVETY